MKKMTRIKKTNRFNKETIMSFKETFLGHDTHSVTYTPEHARVFHLTSFRPRSIIQICTRLSFTWIDFICCVTIDFAPFRHYWSAQIRLKRSFASFACLPACLPLDGVSWQSRWIESRSKVLLLNHFWYCSNLTNCNIVRLWDNNGISKPKKCTTNVRHWPDGLLIEQTKRFFTVAAHRCTAVGV